jgi:hypothetical protein
MPLLPVEARTRIVTESVFREDYRDSSDEGALCFPHHLRCLSQRNARKQYRYPANPRISSSRNHSSYAELRKSFPNRRHLNPPIGTCRMQIEGILCGVSLNYFQTMLPVPAIMRVCVSAGIGNHGTGTH